uniref:SCIII25 protein n=1 Tax=Amanita muscaria TaxID=41956 RepID=O93966_AMAMU|nr:SCIII25 protein [Amanita muscaria]
MRFSTVFVSSAFVFAGMTAALPVGREDMLVARFADSDILDEVEARAYDEEAELYARGGALSKISGGKKDNPPSYRAASRDPPPAYRPSPNHPPPLPDFRREPDYSHNHKSPSHTSHRRSYYAADENDVVARGKHTVQKSVGGDKERKDGSPPKYKVACKGPPATLCAYRAITSPPLGPFLTDHHSTHSRHRRSFYDLD